MTISFEREARRSIRITRHEPAPEAPPVFVDDTGRRRRRVRLVWLAALVVTVAFYGSAVVAAFLDGSPAEVGEVGTTLESQPYGLIPSTMGLPQPIVGSAGCAVIEGSAFLDWDLNGARQASTSGTEIGIGGIEVRAFDAAGAEVARAVTADDGTYAMPLNPPADVRLEFSSPTRGFIESPIGIDSKTSTQFPRSPDCSADVGLVWRNSATAPDAKADRHGVGQVSGWAWVDDDCDAVIDPGEVGASGTPVDLTDPFTGRLVAATSTIDGAFSFGGIVPEVRYQISISDRAQVVPVPRADTTAVSPMDGSVLQYVNESGRMVVRFYVDELGQSRHGVAMPVAPSGGCPTPTVTTG
jgi:hypothetical protein